MPVIPHQSHLPQEIAALPEVMPSLEDIQAFLAVLHHGSFVGAARALDIEAALVSKRVARLERSLSVKLFARTTRRVSPTAEARLYGLRAAEATLALSRANEEVRAAQSALSGMIRIAAPNPFGRRYVAQAIAAFRRDHANVEFDLRLSDHVVDLVREGFDVAIRIGTVGGARLVARRLADDIQCLCASPAYLAVHGVPRHPQDLARHRYLAFASAQGIERQLRLTGPRGQSANVTMSERLRSDSGEALREWALAGEGISQRSTWDVVDELRTGALVRVLDEWKLATKTIHVVRPHRAASERVRHFVHFLVAHFAKAPWATSP